MSLARDRILELGAAPIVSPPVPVPEWGGEVHVRVMTGAERDAFEIATVPPLGSLRNVRARLIVACACDERGTRLFEDGDVEAVGALDARALDRVFRAARELNALGPDQVEAIKKN